MIVLLIVCFSILYGYWHILTRRPRNFPPGPNWYPIVGSSYFLRKEIKKHGSLYLVYEEWSRKYNSSVIGFKLGRELVVVALDYPSIYTIHTKDTFDGRPDNFFFRLRTMGKRQGITFTDGLPWTEHRAFALRHLKQAGYGRQPMEVALKEELYELLDVIDANDGRAIAPGTIISPSVMNVLWIFVAGKKIGRHNESLNLLLNLLRQRSKAFDISGGILNSMPWLRYIAPEKTGYKLIQKFNEEIHKFLADVISQHKDDYTAEKSSQDLIYAYIKEIQEQGQNGTFTEDQLTFSILDIFIAGSETTSTTLELALMTMAVYPDIQKRVQLELDEKLENNELPDLNGRTQFPYTEAVIMEAQRFYHILPITGPRRNFVETTLAGYNIPQETTIFIGLRQLLMDKDYWGDPDIFRPERFLSKDMAIINTERFLPFGQGRRRCLGEILARGCLFMFFVGIVRKFSISQSDCDAKPDRNLLPGIVLTPKPYKIIFSERKHT